MKKAELARLKKRVKEAEELDGQVDQIDLVIASIQKGDFRFNEIDCKYSVFEKVDASLKVACADAIAEILEGYKQKLKSDFEKV